MSRQNLAWKDFRNRMQEKRRGGKRKSYCGFKKLFYLIDTKPFSRKLENRNKSSLQKIYICNLSSNADLASRGSYCLASLFYSHGRQEEKTREREDIIKKGVVCLKTKL